MLTYPRTIKKTSRNASMSNWHGLQQGNLLDYMEKLSKPSEIEEVSPSEIFSSLSQVDRKVARKTKRVKPELPVELQEPEQEEPIYWWLQ